MAQRQAQLDSLPFELLDQIITHFDPIKPSFADYSPIRNPFVNRKSKKNRRALVSLRETCRTLHDVATPKLFRVMAIEFSDASLRNAESLIRSPRVGHHIRAIKVSIGFCASDLAYDFERFYDQKLLVLDNARSSISSKIKSVKRHYSKLIDGLDREDCKRQVAMLEESKERFKQMKEAWKLKSLSTEEEIKELHHYHDAMRQGYNKFRARHDEQLRMLYDGSFATRIAAIYAYLPNALPLCLSDYINYGCGSRMMRDAPEVFLYDDKLADHLGEPGSWTWSRDQWPTRLMFDIPAAIHKAGAKLSLFQIDVFPGYNHIENLVPQLDTELDVTYSDYLQGLNEAESFRFGLVPLTCANLRYDHSYKEQNKTKSIHNYLAAGIGSSKLREMHLTLDTFCAAPNTLSKKKVYDAGGMFHNVRSNQLRRISIANMHLTQSSLEHLFNSIDPEEVDLIRMFDINVSPGRWRYAIEALRKNVSARCQARKCIVSLDTLIGGEFEIPVMEQLDLVGLMVNPNPRRWDEPELLSLTHKYVRGANIRNPFVLRREREKQEARQKESKKGDSSNKVDSSSSSEEEDSD